MDKNRWVFVALAAALLLISAAAALLGPGMGIAASARGVFRIFSGGEAPAEVYAVLTYRLTRLGASLVVGAALAVAGVSLQALLRNPLADPYILGISAGGGFGAAAAVALGLAGLGGFASFSAVNGCAFLGALVAVAAAYIVARSAGILSVHALLLAGVMVGAFFTSLILLLLAIVPARDQHQVFLWLMGDLGSPDITPARVAAAAVLVTASAAGLAAFARSLDVIALGDESAFHLGVRVEIFKGTVLLLASLATAAAVALAGPIGFVGIVVPHALRRIIGPRHLPLLGTSVLGGAALVALGDTLVRASADYFSLPIVPVGVFTALIGAPYYLALLKSRSGS